MGLNAGEIVTCWSGSGWAGAVLVLVLSEGVAAQVRTISDCEQPCLLRTELVATLGAEDGPGFVGEPSGLVRLGDGRWVLSDWYDQDRLKVYDSDGAFLRAVGRRGQGPGEFHIARFLQLLPGDSVEVFDFGLMRTTVFTPDWVPVRTARWPMYGQEMVRLPDGARVFSSRWNEPGREGQPLHLVSSSGSYVRSFGAREPIPMSGPREAYYRQIALSGSDRVWSANLLRYHVEEWSVEGEFVQELERTVEWFPPQVEYEAVPADGGPPTPGLLAVHADGDGLLWVVTVVPATDWELGVGTGRNVFGRSTRVVSDPSAVYDTMIEVIDPADPVVVGAARLSTRIEGFVSDGFVYGGVLLPTGEPVVQIWALSLIH